MKKHQFIDLLYSFNIHDHTLSQDFMELLITREDHNGSETSQLKSIQYFFECSRNYYSSALTGCTKYVSFPEGEFSETTPKFK